MAALLIVDDYQLIREVLVELFTPEHACETAESAEQALTLLESKHFDVAIVDISLPGMSGLELFGHIRQRWPETQVIIITGIDYHQYVENLIGMGASDYLVKPFQLQDVETSVARANLKQEGWLEAVKESTRLALGQSQSSAVEVSGGMIERRRAVRRNIQRAARLIFATAPADLSVAESAQPTPTIIGHTRDISATGLSLIVPGIHESDGKFYGVRSQVRINLSLPKATIDIEVKPVRYEWLGEHDGKRSYLIGAHIVRMSEDDRTKFNDYLGQASGPPANPA
jgi:DNA-binding response OmpR family regulator